MKSPICALVLAVVACEVAGCRGTSQQQPRVDPQPSPAMPRRANPHQEMNDRHVQQFLQEIAGRENEPAEKVFKNIQSDWLKSVQAGRFLLIMNRGYSRALGVECTHCHVEEDFSSDEKRPKRAAREMAVMHRMINDQLAKMQHLDLEPGKRFVNCSTCHRGTIKPAR